MVLTPTEKGAAVLALSYRFVLKVGEIFYCDAYGPWEKKSMVYCYHQQPLATGQPKTESDAAYLPSFYAYSDKQTIPKTV